MFLVQTILIIELMQTIYSHNLFTGLLINLGLMISSLFYSQIKSYLRSPLFSLLIFTISTI